MYCTKLQLPPEPLTRGLRPQIPVLSVLCPQLNLLKTPPPKNLGYTTDHYNLKLDTTFYVLRLMLVSCTNCMVSSEMNFFSHTPVDIWTSEIPNTNLYTIFYVPIRLNPSNAEINPLYHLLALLGTHHILHVSRVRIKLLCYSLLVKRIHYGFLLQQLLSWNSSVNIVTRLVRYEDKAHPVACHEGAVGNYMYSIVADHF